MSFPRFLISGFSRLGPTSMGLALILQYSKYITNILVWSDYTHDNFDIFGL